MPAKALHRADREIELASDLSRAAPDAMIINWAGDDRPARIPSGMNMPVLPAWPEEQETRIAPAISRRLRTDSTRLGPGTLADPLVDALMTGRFRRALGHLQPVPLDAEILSLAGRLRASAARQPPP
jgi:hypothetical protein